MKLNSIIDLALSSSVLSEVVLDDGRISRNDLAVTPAISGLSYVDYDASDVGDIAFKLNSILAAFKGDPQPTPPGPVQEFDLSVGCEYLGLETGRQVDAKLFVDGVETAFGSVIRRPAGTVVRLEAAIEGDDAHTVGCTGWSDGSASPAIDFVIDADSELTAVFARFGSEYNPWPIESAADLQNLKAVVDDGALSGCWYAADDCYRQTQDIDMAGTPWSGIGRMSASAPKYDPDPDHTFKGTYDGGGHTIDNLVLHCLSTDTGTSNRYKALFRTAGYGATIKNLTVNVNGVDHWEEEDIMAAAFVGVTDGGLTIENCTANGTLGTLEQPLDNSAGILCRIATGGATAPETTFTDVTNNVDIVGICKIGGMVSYAYGTLNFTNVVNNGDLTRKGLDATRNDGVGSLVGWGDQTNAHVTYNFDGVKNTGAIASDLTTYAHQASQLVGKWSLMNGSNSGDVAVLDSADVPAAGGCPTGGSNPGVLRNELPVYFGVLGEDGLVHGASSLEDGKSYIYMARNVSEGSTPPTAVSGPAYVLPSGSTITVEHRFGTPNITDSGNNPIAGESVGGNVYRYSA